MTDIQVTLQQTNIEARIDGAVIENDRREGAVYVGTGNKANVKVDPTDSLGTNHTLLTQAFLSASQAGKWVELTSDIIVSNEVIIPTELKLDGRWFKIKIKDGSVNFDLFKSQNFDLLSYTNKKGQGVTNDLVVGANNVTLLNLILDGNEANVSFASSSTDNRTRKALIKKYGYRWTVKNCRFINAKSNGIYKEWCLSSGMTSSNYFDMEDDWDNIRVLNYGFNGVIDRGPNDSIWRNSFYISYKTTVEWHFRFETSPLFTSSSAIIRDCHVWGSAKAGGMYVGGALIVDDLATFAALPNYGTDTQAKILNLDMFAMRGSIYCEGVPADKTAMYLQAQKCDLSVYPSNCGVGIDLTSNNNTLNIMSLHGTVTGIQDSVVKIGRNASGLLEARAVTQNIININGNVADNVGAAVIDFVNDGGFNQVNAYTVTRETNNLVYRGTRNNNTQLKTRDEMASVGGTLSHRTNLAYSTPVMRLAHTGGDYQTFVKFSTPEGEIAASRGDLCVDVNTGTLWVKRGTDGTNTGWYDLGQGASTPTVSRKFSQTNSQTITNTTTETTLFGNNFIGNLSYPANSLTAGEVNQIKMSGVYFTDTTTQNITIRAKMGTTTFSPAPVITLPANQTNQLWELEAEITTRIVGVSGTSRFNISGKITFFGSSVTVGQFNMTISATTVNTTIENILDVTAQWANATTANRIETRAATVVDIV